MPPRARPEYRDVQSVIASAVGGDNIARRLKACSAPDQRRYPRELRDSLEKLRRCRRH